VLGEAFNIVFLRNVASSDRSLLVMVCNPVPPLMMPLMMGLAVISSTRACISTPCVQTITRETNVDICDFFLFLNLRDKNLPGIGPCGAAVPDAPEVEPEVPALAAGPAPPVTDDVG
jgi:hypothetical protein